MENNKDSEQFLITTIDNPYNPFTQPDEWYNFDVTYGYFTYQNLVKLVDFDEDMTEEEENKAYETAMDKLLKIHPMYIKVKSDSDIGEKLKALREVYLQELKNE
jgi:hypothetical protein